MTASVGGGNQVCQYDTKTRSLEQAYPARMASEGDVPTAHAQKAGSARKATRLTPKPPSLIGKLACNHYASDKSELVIRLSAEHNRSSKVASAV